MKLRKWAEYDAVFLRLVAAKDDQCVSAAAMRTTTTTTYYYMARELRLEAAVPDQELHFLHEQGNRS